jgi:ABC-type spermidine/putrescine transport system permease subunit I
VGRPLVNLGKQTYIVLGNLAERKMRTVTAAFVIAFAVAVVMVVVALMLGFLQSATEKAREAFPAGPAGR